MCRWESEKIQGKIFLGDENTDVEEPVIFLHGMWSVKAVCGAVATTL